MSTQNQRYNNILNKRQRTESPNPDPDMADPPHQEVQQIPLPRALISLLKTTAKHMAAIACAASNCEKKAVEFEKNLEDGVIPKHLEFRFKKLYTAPHETAIRTSLIQAGINHEIELLQNKHAELQNKYENRVATLMQSIGPVLAACDLEVSENAMETALEAEIQDFKIAFLLKQSADDAKKRAKQEKFNAVQAFQAQEATISNKDVQVLHKKVMSLQKQLKDLTLKKGNGKGAAPRPTAAPQAKKKKQTGTKKKEDGNRNASAKNKKSPGKNGKSGNRQRK